MTIAFSFLFLLIDCKGKPPCNDTPFLIFGSYICISFTNITHFDWIDILCVSNLVATHEGRLCVFPFSYKGVTYNHCTDVDNDRRLWCAYTPYYNGQWGTCMETMCGGMCWEISYLFYLPNTQLMENYESNIFFF